MKKLMILGGSKYILPVIEEAHKLGIYVITCDYLPNNIAHKFSDEYINVSIIDKEKTLKAAQYAKIDGIMSFACDPGVITAAYVAEKMHLPSVGSYEAVSILQDKAKFRNFLAKHNFNVPRAQGYSNIDDALKSIDEFNLPVIVKPVDSAGSKGVSKVSHKKELKDAIATALNYSISKHFIIEEFIEPKGHPSDSDCFSLDGELKVVTFSSQRFDKETANIFTPCGFSYTSSFTKKERLYLESEIQRLITLLNLKTSLYNIETRVGKDGLPYIMEVSPRGGGNRISEMINLEKSINLIKLAVMAAVGLEISDNFKEKRNGHIFMYVLHSDIDGKFEKLIVSEEISKYIYETDLWVKPNDIVKSFSGANATIGTIVMRFKTKKELMKYTNNMRDYIKVVVK